MRCDKLRLVAILLAAVGLLGLTGPAQGELLELITPTLNDGSFESLDDDGVGNASADNKLGGNASATIGSAVTPGYSGVYGGVWTIKNNGGGSKGGWLDRGPDSKLESDGLIGVFQDDDNSTSVLESIDILGTSGYATVNDGDVFSGSFDVNAHVVAAGTTSYSTVSLSFDGGTSWETVGTQVADDGLEDAFQTGVISYTATELDASGAAINGLRVQFTLHRENGNNWSDNVQLSVTPIPEPASVALLLTGLLGLIVVRRRK